MKGKMCRWRGRGANEEEDVPMKWNMCQWSGICGHEGEDVPMKGKMCPWRGRCAHEEEDVPMKRKMWPWRCGNSRFKKLKTRAFAKAFRESKLPAKARVSTPSTKNGLRVSLRAGCPPVYRAATTKKNTAHMGICILESSRLDIKATCLQFRC